MLTGFNGTRLIKCCKLAVTDLATGSHNNKLELSVRILATQCTIMHFAVSLVKRGVTSMSRQTSWRTGRKVAAEELSWNITLAFVSATRRWLCCIRLLAFVAHTNGNILGKCFQLFSWFSNNGAFEIYKYISTLQCNVPVKNKMKVPCVVIFEHNVFPGEGCLR